VKFVLQYLLLVLGFALLTYGLVNWGRLNFSLTDAWFSDGQVALHPLHLLILGIAMIPPAMWELFVLDSDTEAPPIINPVEPEGSSQPHSSDALLAKSPK